MSTRSKNTGTIPVDGKVHGRFKSFCKERGRKIGWAAEKALNYAMANPAILTSETHPPAK